MDRTTPRTRGSGPGRTRRWWTGAVALAVAGTSALGPGSPAAARDGGGQETRRSPVTIVTKYYDGAYGIDVTRRGVLAADPSEGTVTLARPGYKRALMTDLPGVAGVAGGRGRVFAVIGGPDEIHPDIPATAEPSTVVTRRYGGGPMRVVADLLAHELAENPDGQVQLVDGAPVDTLSNPFSMATSRRGLLVADAGANDVLLVDPRTGDVSTFFVPPTVTRVPACLEDGVQANPGTVGCDAVPTGVAARDGRVYVSTLGAQVPGAGRVYELGLRSGTVLRTWRNLTAPTGVAVRRGAVHVSEGLHGLGAGNRPPPRTDPATIGRITRLAHGRRTHAQVTMPVGLDVRRGRLFSSAYALAPAIYGEGGRGKVVRVAPFAFR